MKTSLQEAGISFFILLFCNVPVRLQHLTSASFCRLVVRVHDLESGLGSNPQGIFYVKALTTNFYDLVG